MSVLTSLTYIVVVTAALREQSAVLGSVGTYTKAPYRGCVTIHATWYAVIRTEALA